MTKSDLRVNDIVTCRNGNSYIIMEFDNQLYLVSDTEYGRLRCFPDMTDETEASLDIMIVRRPEDARQLIYTRWEEAPVIYEREEVREVTMAEVEEKFGCKIRIIE